MIIFLEFIIYATISFILAIPYITIFCVGLYSAFLTIISIIVETSDKILTTGYSASAIACFAGSIYGACTNRYSYLCYGPLILALVYGYHRITYR